MWKEGEFRSLPPCHVSSRHSYSYSQNLGIWSTETLSRDLGKDKIIFVTKEDHETPSSAELIADDPNDPYEDHGLILPNGDINWNCPCLGGMASGPCGEQFKSAFSCFHYSKEEVKGSDCIEEFRTMQECMQRFPELYPQEEDEDPQSKDAVTPSSDTLPTDQQTAAS
ncbi:MIA40 protein, partial [Polypterus senegalus]|nr:MIA40 protein [Polypterus senegalus]